MLISFIITFLILSPQYSSRSQMIVSLPSKNDPEQNINDLNYNLQMLDTYKDIITEGDSFTETVKGHLASKYDIHLSKKEVKDSLKVKQSENSQMFSIVATGDSPATAKNIANTAAEVFRGTVKDMLPNVDKITIVSRASENQDPVSPKKNVNLVVGLLLGFLVGVIIAFVKEIFDRTIKSERYITDSLDLTVLGSIPNITQKELDSTTQKLPVNLGRIQRNSTINDILEYKKVAKYLKTNVQTSKSSGPVSLITLIDPTSTIAERFRTIRTNIQFASSVDNTIKSLVITSSGPAEGKSMTAANLAIVFAKSGKKTLLVDADLRKPTVDKTFQLRNGFFIKWY